MRLFDDHVERIAYAAENNFIVFYPTSPVTIDLLSTQDILGLLHRTAQLMAMKSLSMQIEGPLSHDLLLLVLVIADLGGRSHPGLLLARALVRIIEGASLALVEYSLIAAE